MISDDGVPLLMDIGLALIVSRAEFTVPGIYGPCRWQPPEVLDPAEDSLESPYTMQSDIYSLGMTILEVLTGRAPFRHRRYDTVVILDVIRGARPLRSAEISDVVWELLQYCWNAAPQDRPTATFVRSWLDMACCLERCTPEELLKMGSFLETAQRNGSPSLLF